MFPHLPKLKILPVPSLLLHEEHDRRRAQRLAEKLRAQGILRNPPIVMALGHAPDRYVVLDGANRVTALEEMQVPHIAAQVVEADDPEVRLSTWNHVIWGMPASELLAEIRRVPGIDLMPIDPKKLQSTESDCTPVELQFAHEQAFLVCTSSDPVQQLASLHSIVDCYKDRASLDRTEVTKLESFAHVHPDLTALIIFLNFDIPTVLSLASQGHVFPTGITHFTVSPRALHINYPLERLAGADSTEHKQAELDRWIQERLQSKNVRHYTEETFMFDE